MKIDFFPLSPDIDHPDYDPGDALLYSIGQEQATVTILYSGEKVLFRYYRNDLEMAQEHLTMLLEALPISIKATHPSHEMTLLPLAFPEDVAPNFVSQSAPHNLLINDGFSSISIYNPDHQAALLEALKTFETQLLLTWK